MGHQLRTLIVDHDVICRDTLKRALEEATDIEVVGAAPTARLGLDRVRQYAPDLVIFDTTLDDMSPREFTDAVFRHSPLIGVLLTSSLDPAAVDRTIAALEHGAFDFIIKPAYRCPDDAIPQLRRMLFPKIRCFSIKRYSRQARGLSSYNTVVTSRLEILKMQDSLHAAKAKTAQHPVDVVLIGVSTGGPEALLVLLSALPAKFRVPIVIVLHMPPMFTERLAETLNRDSRITVKEAADDELLRPGVAYLAPGGRHLSLVQKGSGYKVHLSDEPAENGFRPSVDMLFRTAAKSVGKRAVAVVLTGMGCDGTEGLRQLKAAQAMSLVQDEATSVVWGMPGSAVRAGVADEVLPLNQMSERLVELTGGGGA